MKLRLLELAKPYIRSFKVAVDGGGYRGEWTLPLTEMFGLVYVFEPQQERAKALALLPKTQVEAAALADRPGHGFMVIPTWIDPRKGPATDRSTTVLRNDESGEVKLVRLDDYDLAGCGLIKLNVEGCEAMTLDGGTETLKRERPVVLIESSHPKKLPDPYKGEPARADKILESLGYVTVDNIGNDFLWVHREHVPRS